MQRLIHEKNRGDSKNTIARRHTSESFVPHGKNTSDAQSFPLAAKRTKIGFVGFSAGAGATTLAFAAAEYLAAMTKMKRSTEINLQSAFKPRRTHFTDSAKSSFVAMLEINASAQAPAGFFYDKIGADRRFAGRPFISFYRLAAEGKPLSGIYNLDGGINWALRIPLEAGPCPAPAVFHRMLNNIDGDIILADISAQNFLALETGNRSEEISLHLQENREILQGLLADLDLIICVIDPLPSRLLAGAKIMECIRVAQDAGVSVSYVFNKLNPGVNLREALRFTGIRNYHEIHALPAETLYAAEYACRSIASEHEIKNSLAAIFRA